MRATISVIVALVIFIIVAYLAYSGGVVMPDYWTGLTVALTVVALSVLLWGFKPRIYQPFKEKRDSQIYAAETTPAEEDGTERPALPLNRAEILKLGVTDALLDEVYNRAQKEAIAIYHDAQLSTFSFQVLFCVGHLAVNIWLSFYAKWANKICKFVYDVNAQKFRHSGPDKRPFPAAVEVVFTTLPWKESPQWMEFIERAYAKIEPLTPVDNSGYQLFADPDTISSWYVNFHDGFSGAEHSFRWNGNGLDGSNIRQTS